VRENNILLERNGIYENTKIAVEKMLKSSNYKFLPLNIDDSVTVSVPKVDRGPLDARNIEGIIMDCRNGI